MTTMTCPECNGELEQGFLFSTKDGAFSFADEVPSSFKDAKNAPGFVQITAPKVGGRANVPALLCRACRQLIVTY
ncbi:PF20097 family protein [Bifidobacterium gallicum]|uniref:DUF6487 domain-containing protein n=1 Tax=Bifidobacterium gallicum DSM 20093 = LMG 11596 TaxID=561180 RepID=D1NS85_9BIFI|nr:PF20097 family protein [Bifidobacterium gallicum]EFA23537.1 hypothetical protein BIFGAL_02641 [Bifidobacterium gallicum DSM 20093 = LMG 11596]